MFHKYSNTNVGIYPKDSLKNKVALGERTYKVTVDGHDVAMKCLSNEAFGRGNSYYEARDFDNEFKSLKYLFHPNLVQMLGYSDDPRHGRNFITEFMPHGTLTSLVLDANRHHAKLPWVQKYSIARDIAQGLAYLHTNALPHRRLTPDSIFFDECNGYLIAKINGHGFYKARSTSSERYLRWTHPIRFTRGHAQNPPEFLLLDTYSFGMILWYLATQKLPFEHITNYSELNAHITQGNTEIIPPDCLSPYLDIIHECWKLPASKFKPTEIISQQRLGVAPTARELAAKVSELHDHALSLSVQNTLIQSHDPLENNYEEQIRKHLKHFGHFYPTPKKNKTNSQFQLKQDVGAEPRNEPKSDGPHFSLQDADQHVLEMVAKSYMLCPVPGFAIGRVQVIYNRELALRFNNILNLLEHRAMEPQFYAPKWPLDDSPEKRREVDDNFYKLNKDYFDSNYPHVRAAGVWHGTNSTANVASICSNGFGIREPLNGALFGQAVYGAVEAKCARELYQKGQQSVPLIFYIAATLSPYPVIKEDNFKLLNHANHKNYDAHVIPVAPDIPDAQNPTYLSTKLGEHQYTEVGVFDPGAALPYCVVDLVEIPPGIDNQLSFKTENLSAAPMSFFKQNTMKKLLESFALTQTQYILLSDNMTVISANKMGRLIALNPYTGNRQVWQAHAGNILEIQLEKNEKMQQVIVSVGEDEMIKTWLFDTSTFQYHEYKNEIESTPQYVFL